MELLAQPKQSLINSCHGQKIAHKAISYNGTVDECPMCHNMLEMEKQERVHHSLVLDLGNLQKNINAKNQIVRDLTEQIKKFSENGDENAYPKCNLR